MHRLAIPIPVFSVVSEAFSNTGIGTRTTPLPSLWVISWGGIRFSLTFPHWLLPFELNPRKQSLCCHGGVSSAVECVWREVWLSQTADIDNCLFNRRNHSFKAQCLTKRSKSQWPRIDNPNTGLVHFLQGFTDTIIFPTGLEGKGKWRNIKSSAVLQFTTRCHLAFRPLRVWLLIVQINN